jgi:hypothetical protein
MNQGQKSFFLKLLMRWIIWQHYRVSVGHSPNEVADVHQILPNIDDRHQVKHLTKLSIPSTPIVILNEEEHHQRHQQTGDVASNDHLIVVEVQLKNERNAEEENVDDKQPHIVVV